jgi:hypothetical protein
VELAENDRRCGACDWLQEAVTKHSLAGLFGDVRVAAPSGVRSFEAGQFCLYASRNPLRSLDIRDANTDFSRNVRIRSLPRLRVD